MHESLFTTGTVEWATPMPFFLQLDAEFRFTLDPCATAENAKCKKFFTKENNGLLQSWANEVVYMNPPYGRNHTVHWIKKAYDESKRGATVVCVIPARPDAFYWHDYIIPYADETRFKKGRVNYESPGGGKNRKCPFPTAVIVFRPGLRRRILSSFK